MVQASVKGPKGDPTTLAFLFFEDPKRRADVAMMKVAGMSWRVRCVLMAALSGAGYGPILPEGTFYLFARWPDGDPGEHWNRVADRDVFVMPGSILAAPDWFRISLTASDAMVEKAVPAFREAAAEARAGQLRAAG